MRHFRQRPFLRVFLDTSAQKHAVTHSFVTRPVSIKWGDSTVNARVAVLGRKRKSGNWLPEQVRSLARLCEAAEAGIIEFCISDETLFEGLPESALGTETDLSRRVHIRKIRPPVDRTDLLLPTKEYVRGIHDDRYRKINNATHEHHPIDAFHLWTAEANGVDRLLMIDGAFLRAFRNQKAVQSRTIPVSASELWHELRWFYPVLLWRRLLRAIRVTIGKENGPDTGFSIID